VITTYRLSPPSGHFVAKRTPCRHALCRTINFNIYLGAHTDRFTVTPQCAYSVAENKLDKTGYHTINQPSTMEERG
jgi:hypothetical protein